MWLCDKQSIKPVNENDPELKIKLQLNIVKADITVPSKLEMISSSWIRLRKIMVVVLLAANIWIKRITKPRPSEITTLINMELLEKAQKMIFKMLQQHSFSHEISSLKSNTIIHRSISLFILDPFLDTDGVLRVGGRLKRSMLDINEVHPVILPKTNLITEAIVTWCHENVAHSGRSMNNLRKNGLWVISANSVVRRTIFRCVTCHKLRGAFGYQKMADLPKDRCIEAPPFTHCGVDMFGPFVTRERRSDLKRYCALFTYIYFASRAVHIEVANAMDTDSFIQALRRFIARRGTVRSIRSDNRTNFVGASNELKKVLDEMNQEQIRQHLLKSGTDWVKWQKNPPGASHMGSIWESQIRSARTILEALLKTHGSSLNDENLRTLITETEAIINSRPLTVETLSDVNSEMPLSPSHLLTMKTEVVLPPPGTFSRPDIYSRRRWRRVQHIASKFWTQSRKEFLGTLQLRQKWNNQKQNFKAGDLVLLREDSIRSKWPMARIVETEPDSTGVVCSVKLKLGDASLDSQMVLQRLISKIVLLVEDELVQFPDKGSH